MVKYILLLMLIFSVGLLTAQNGSIENNQGQAFSTLANGMKNFGASASFKNHVKEIKGTVYLFDNWENSGIIITTSKQRYLVRNININIQQNILQSRISKDSLFSFNFNNIDNFVINDKVYKNFYTTNNGSRIYEIIYESDEFSILKGFDLQLVLGSPNPMVNRSNDKYVRKKGYYLSSDATIVPFHLSKNGVLKLLNGHKERIAKIEQFMDSERLSYKNEEDIKKALEFVEVQ